MSTHWKKKLAAWVHDPAEKSLVLMRDRVGHEQGTVRDLRQRLGIQDGDFDRRADHLAAAADRPNWPFRQGERFPAWATVRFTEQPQLIHPLSGARFDLHKLTDIGVDHIKDISLQHFQRLIQAGGDDPRRTFLAFWRFGPEGRLADADLGALWQELPADTRTPDHTIWAHLDTVSALHTALDQGDEPCLLALSFGPVQGFISQGRSTSDLWAGSHLLSSLVWAALREIAGEVGPDAVLFPALRGVPAVDAWLLEEGGEAFRELFQELGADFLARRDDTNPLFSAALPNKCLCLVPARRARELAERAIAAARRRALDIAHEAARRVFKEAGCEITDTTRNQIEKQMAAFPEAFWTAARWPVGEDHRDIETASQRLQTALGQIHPDLEQQGVFTPATWAALNRQLDLEGWTFWRPNAGILYPAVHELTERHLAAGKTIRPFEALKQKGHRCTQCGEREWLTPKPELLPLNRRDRQQQSPWGRLAEKRRAWAKGGEHLCALCTAKRLWPSLFTETVEQHLDMDIRRFVVSTHALALSTTLWQHRDETRRSPDQSCHENKLKQRLTLVEAEPTVLPRKLARELPHQSEDMQYIARRLPSALEMLKDDAAIQGVDAEALERDISSVFKPRETYYALIQMDGDRMGAWFAGNEEAYTLRYQDTWHDQIRAQMDRVARKNRALHDYMETRRPPSPGRHGALSSALNHFSLHLARYVVEDCVKGKLIYAGGDDVLALVAVDDLLDAMQLLRLAYSGLAPDPAMGLDAHVGRLLEGGGAPQDKKLLLKDGFGLLHGRLMRLMGHRATASMGAVVAHHQAPLARVLRELREAEAGAKSAGRNRFCLRVLKRGGGAEELTAPWWPLGEQRAPRMDRATLTLMGRLRDELAHTDFSRGAIYRAQLWFEGLTDRPQDKRDPRWRAQMAGALAQQFTRQAGSGALAREIVDFVCDTIDPAQPRTAIGQFLAVSEFFARPERIRPYEEALA
ncbi:type III-B CRISPR-associated protein Cas10/Cmr2 [Ectothiorhodospira mobilis]|uniref:type III-B CRISPR-associated protein Cas10/Cmr2 n=1 Tax=Ectothiorhodospira mobilis TaxID=195064 RepID=UPI001904729D|nr:type III-B CRISPR-associated protein Cas10/Cmr2 [Ectothiorhodospira mobilis]